MNGFPRFAAALSAALIALAIAMQAGAKDTRSEAREAYDAGTVAFEKEDYAGALAQFKAANELLPTPQALFWVARALDKLERKDEAINAYQELLDHPDIAKLGIEKRGTAQDRLTALKAESEQAPAPTVEQLPRGPVQAPPQFAPPTQGQPKLRWKNHLVEVGVLTGPLFLNSKHNLVEEDRVHADYTLAWLLGARFGYYPVRFVGFEVDGAYSWARVKGDASPGGGDDSAQFIVTRGYVVGQYPIDRFVPFALVGAGVIHANSDRLGEDIDFMLVGGAGVKVAVTKVFTPRLDWHLGMTQRQGGGFSEGLALHTELLLGIDFTLGR
jgi:hypothetical protein